MGVVLNAIGAHHLVLSYLSPFILISGVSTHPEKEHGSIFQPIFISVDPARDTPSSVARYLRDFHPSFTGLVGSYASTKSMCKAYRVYFSTPPDADPSGDYLVDHSIFVYLMDPKGEFVDAFGQSVGVQEVVEKVREVLQDWEGKNGKKV